MIPDGKLLWQGSYLKYLVNRFFIYSKIADLLNQGFFNPFVCRICFFCKFLPVSFYYTGGPADYFLFYFMNFVAD